MGSLAIVKSHFLFNELLLLLSEVVIPQELVIARSLFPEQLHFFPQLVDFQLHASAVVVVVEGVPLLVIVLGGEQA